MKETKLNLIKVDSHIIISSSSSIFLIKNGVDNGRQFSTERLHRISRKLGIVGFCFGGGKLIETLARDQQGHFGMGISFYGTRIDTSLSKDIKVPILFICGDNDHLCPISTLQEMEKNAEGSKVVIYPGRGHGFAHRPESQEDDTDAENAFAIMRSWLHDCLVLSKNHVF